MAGPEFHIEKAPTMGFCSGVKRAVTILERTARDDGPLQTLGPAVHNPPLVEKLSGLGVSVAGSLENVTETRVAIPSHGAAPEVLQELTAQGRQIVDTTCPIVHKAQVAAHKLGKDGFFVVIFGDAAHPEVKGLLGWAGSQSLATRDVSGLAKLEKWPRKIGILAQTTQNSAMFAKFVKEVVDLAQDRFAEVRILNTVCNVTHRQQQAAGKLARKVELMIVVGGKQSSNTRRLVEMCQEVGTETRAVETAGEIEASWLAGKHRIGVTAGTSTPNWSINEVIDRVKELLKEVQKT